MRFTFNSKEIGFAICSKCNMIMVSSAKGGTSKLLDHCKKKHDYQQPITHFSTHKRNLDDKTKEDIKEAQVNFAIDTLTGLNIQESPGFYQFCDFMMQLGSKYGTIESKNFLFGYVLLDQK